LVGGDSIIYEIKNFHLYDLGDGYFVAERSSPGARKVSQKPQNQPKQQPYG
jgi:hypothetical protein